MKKKVYISSTLDLADYRNVIETTFRKHAKFFEIVRIAEYMTPESGSALDACLKDVDSCDLYVLIIGRRYGSLATNKEISYTHCEYKRAIEESKPPKEIIVFYASDKAAGLKEETAHPEKFKEFKDIVLSRHLGYTSGFADPADLIIQLQNALLLRVLENLPVISNEAIEYKCNRNEQVSTYKGEVVAATMKAGNVITAVFFGTENDKPKNFTERLVRLEFQLSLKLFLTKGLMIDSTVQEKCMMNLVRNIYEQLFPEDKNYYRDRELVRNFVSPKSFFAMLHNKKIKELFIEFLIDMDDHDTDSELLINTLKSFISNLEQDVPDAMFLHSTFSVTSKKNFSEVAEKYNEFKKNFNGLADISYLKMINRKHIYNWIETELKLDLPDKINYHINKYFDKGEFEITLSVAQEKLQTMVNEMYFNIK